MSPISNNKFLHYGKEVTKSIYQSYHRYPSIFFVMILMLVFRPIHFRIFSPFHLYMYKIFPSHIILFYFFLVSPKIWYFSIFFGGTLFKIPYYRTKVWWYVKLSTIFKTNKSPIKPEKGPCIYFVHSHHKAVFFRIKTHAISHPTIPKYFGMMVR